MRSPRITAVALAALVSLPAFAADRAIRPGQYELKTEMKMEGIDRQIPPTTITHCYTDQDVKDYKKMAEEGQGRNRDCQISDLKEGGGHVSYAMNCKSGAKGTAEMSFSADGYEMTMNLETPGGPHGPMKMKMHTSARRTGDCSK
ncbi:MAG TPA: DUF3617 family protein [Thermoanaerobaculia bacterium]|nr:DUF3617 family protein [Thermoanaerobaculia bacterium]